MSCIFAASQQEGWRYWIKWSDATLQDFGVSLNLRFWFGKAMFYPIHSPLKPELAALQENLVVPDSISSLPIHPSVNSCLKRWFDLAGGLVGLFVTLLVLGPIAIAIWLDNPGPVFYSQVRCGYRGRPFRIWKFRSMVANADELRHLVENQAQGLIFKNDDDLRITRVGRFLRRTSLDEFPQFWNVLKGDMSLVGTRPPTLDEVSQYELHHWQRLNVKPGLTGKWQANGRSAIKDFEAIVKLDLDYQAQWSLGHDVALIWQTIGSVVLSRGAC